MTDSQRGMGPGTERPRFVAGCPFGSETSQWDEQGWRGRTGQPGPWRAAAQRLCPNPLPPREGVLALTHLIPRASGRCQGIALASNWIQAVSPWNLRQDFWVTVKHQSMRPQFWQELPKIAAFHLGFYFYPLEALFCHIFRFLSLFWHNPQIPQIILVAHRTCLSSEALKRQVWGVSYYAKNLYLYTYIHTGTHTGAHTHTHIYTHRHTPEWLVPDHCAKLNNAIKWVAWFFFFFGFPVHLKVMSTLYCSLLRVQ